MSEVPLDVTPDSNLQEAAEAAIHSARLSAVEHLFLSIFLCYSAATVESARFLLDRVSAAEQNNTTVEEALRSVKQGLTVLAHKCMLYTSFLPSAYFIRPDFFFGLQFRAMIPCPKMWMLRFVSERKADAVSPSRRTAWRPRTLLLRRS